MTDTQRLSYLLPTGELIRMNPTGNWRVVRRRPQVLTNRHDIDADSCEIGQTSIDFFAGFAQS